MKLLRFFLILLFFESCEERESLRFTEPQPEGIKNEDGFNKNYQGEYQNPDDSSFLTVSRSYLIKHQTLKWKFHRNDLDSSFRNKSDEEIKDELLKDEITSFIENDSVLCIWEQRDTIFYLSDKTLIRYLKGSYFLNTKRTDDTWKIARLDLDNRKLSLAYIYPNDSLFIKVPIDSIREIKNDSGQIVNYLIRPTKKELKKLVKADAFKEVNYWIKVKE